MIFGFKNKLDLTCVEWESSFDVNVCMSFLATLKGVCVCVCVDMSGDCQFETGGYLDARVSLCLCGASAFILKLSQ